MNLRSILPLALALFALPVLAQETDTHSAGFDGFTFRYDSSVATNLSIRSYTSEDLTNVFPTMAPHAQFMLYSGSEAPDFPAEAPGLIRVFQTDDFDKGQNSMLLALRTLLTDRPDFIAYEVPNMRLPFLPIYPAGQVIRARAQYVENASMTGISYITAYQEAMEPLLSTNFIYTFQGISTDGAQYISAVFPLDTDLFPAETPSTFDYATFSAEIDAYFAKTITTLNDAVPEAFTPSITALDSVIGSFATASTGGISVPAPGVTPEATNDPGVLAGSWILVSYGTPDNPQTPLETIPVTLNFTADGVNGTAGCNQYSGPFEFSDNTITFGDLITTRMACPEDVMGQENAYLSALLAATTFELRDGQLIISYENGVLVFNAAEEAI